jgi:opacity protein-like surface antigen
MARQLSIAATLANRNFAASVLLAAFVAAPTAAVADQAGVGFWQSGSYASWAASNEQPGFSFTNDYVHSDTTASGDVARALALRIGLIDATLSLQASGTSRSISDTNVLNYGYVFATPVLGGQAAVTVSTIYGRSVGILDVTLNATATTNLGLFSASRSLEVTSDTTAYGDLLPLASLRWNKGDHSWMTYVTGGVPVGEYNPRNLANLGLGFWAVDAGGGYTYSNDKTGLEFSVVAGATYNFINPYTQYQNGIDLHADLAASKMLGDKFFAGAVGYIYDQVTGDRGSGAVLGSFESRIYAVGPQVGYLFPIGKMQGTLNARAYYEFGAVNRPSGWNTWLEFYISPPDPDSAAATTPRRGSRSANSLKRGYYGKAISNYNWTGFYVGVNLGGAWASGTQSDSINAATISADQSGFVGGGQLGYNYQFGHLVLGLEWLFNGTNLKTSGTVGTFAATANTFGISTITGRFGWALNDWLWYAKAGGAFVGHDLTLANSAALVQLHGFRTSTGWTLGAGIEHAVSENWTAKLEYDYLGLTTVNFVATQAVFMADQLSLNRQISMLTVGMNYKFPQ